MKSVSLLTYNLLKLGKKAAESTEGDTSQTSGVTNFPLHHRSKDQFAFVQDNPSSDASISHQSEDYDVYRQLLQVASSSSKFKKFDLLSPEIVNRLDKSQGAAPLHYACMNENLQMIHFLLESGARVDIWDREKRVTPLICASALGRKEAIRLLLQHKCDVNAGFHIGEHGQYSALQWAVAGLHKDIVHLLLENKAYQHSSLPFSETPIHTAVLCGSRDILEMLTKAQKSSANADFQMGPEKNSALHLAVVGSGENSYKLCKILLENGNANADLQNSKGKTPLHLAAEFQNAFVIELLLNHYARVNVVDNMQRTALFYAVSNNRKALDCMRNLVGRGNCNVNHQDKWGNTPLHLAGGTRSAGAAEILLINGADFSIKNNIGVSALSILRKNIPETAALLSTAFDQAVTLTNSLEDDETETGLDCKVDFKYVLPSTLNNERFSTFSCENKFKNASRPKSSRFFSICKFTNRKDNQNKRSTRKETSKIKCLLEEEYSNLLLHPVIHSFLELKWQKVRCFFVPTLTFKVVFIILYSCFLEIPYFYNVSNAEGRMGFEIYCYDSPDKSTHNGTTVKENILKVEKEGGSKRLLWYSGMYVAIVLMSMVNASMEILKVIRAPKQQLRTLHPWILVTVYLMLYYNSTETWDKPCEPCYKPVVALAILLAWVDIWIDMARFPKAGLSIRLFFQVFQNFLNFILPHACLLIGFILSLSLLFNENIEFQSITLTFSKVIRIMAGEGEMPDETLNTTLSADSSEEVILHHLLVVYIFTAFVIIVAIVLMNLLIGLAVNDIQSVYADATVNKLIKQTILINTLETSFCGRWLGILRKFLENRINLFQGQDDLDKTIAFKPYLANDSNLNSDQRKALFIIGSANREKQLQKDALQPNISLSNKIHRKNAVIRKMRSRHSTDDEEAVLVDIIDKLKTVLGFLESKTVKS